jgi:hypothetical protein
MGDKRITYKVLLGKSEGMRALGISRRRWRIILKRFVKKGIRWKDMDWILLAQEKIKDVVKTAMNLQVP